MINLSAYILIQGIQYGQMQLKVDPDQSLLMLKQRLSKVFRLVLQIKSKKQVKVNVCYEQYKLNDFSQMDEVFDDGNYIFIKIQIKTYKKQKEDYKKLSSYQKTTQSSQTHSTIDKDLNEESLVLNSPNNKNNKRDKEQQSKIKKSNRKILQKKKIKKCKQINNSQISILKNNIQTKPKQNRLNKVLSATQKTFNKIIQYMDNYLIFSMLYRHRQFSLLSDIRRYFQQKHGCSIQIQTINQIVSICPSLYQIKNLKNSMFLIKLKSQTNSVHQVNINQRISQFNKCLLQFQNTQIQTVIQKININPKIIQPLKKAIDPKSIFYDKNFSQNLKSIIKHKEKMIEYQKNKNKKPQLIKQYLYIVEQIQSLKMEIKINPTKQSFFQQMLKRIQSSQTILNNFIQFISQRSKYIELAIMNGFCKIIINAHLFSSAKKVITNM